MWDVVGGLRRRRYAATARRWNDRWSLKDIHARYGRRLLAETAANPELARRVEYWVAALEEDLHDHRYRRHSRRGSRSESQTQCVEVAHLGGPAAADNTRPAPIPQISDRPHHTTGNLDR